MNPYKIIIRPVDTEKTRYMASELAQYVFEVHRGANKVEVKQAIESIYDVDVAKVNTMIMPAKGGGGFGRRWSARRSTWKKAVVTLEEGQRIDVFEGG